MSMTSARELVLELHNAALDEALALARGMVLGVLGQVAMLAGGRDRLDHRGPLLGLEAAQLALRRAWPSGVIGTYRHHAP